MLVYFIHNLSPQELSLVYNNNLLISSFNDLEVSENPYLSEILIKQNNKYYYQITNEVNCFNNIMSSDTLYKLLDDYNEDNIYKFNG